MHARIVSIETAAAKAVPGVLAVVTGEAMARVCTGWVGGTGTGTLTSPRKDERIVAILKVSPARWAD